MIICSPELGLNPESNSGGEVYDREVISRLCQNDVRVLALLPKNRPYKEHRNLSVTYASLKPMVPPHIFSFFVLPYLISTYKKKHFDILRVFNPYFAGPAAAVFKKLYPRIPVVASYLHLEAGFNGWIDRQTIKIFDHIITISQATKKEIVDVLHYPAKKVSVAYPGVDNRFKPGQKIGQKFTIMFVGGLKPRKNPEFLLQVLKKINRADVELVYVGDGPLRKRLKGKNVRVTGYISEQDKPAFYHQADVVVLPSVKEGFGMTLLEAGMSEIPVVANDCWSIPEIVRNGKTGFLAKVDDVNDWSNKITRLIESNELRRKMGIAARQLIRTKFTWENNIKIQMEIYESLIR